MRVHTREPGPGHLYPILTFDEWQQILEERKTIVDWIAQLAYEFDFDCLTVHMAVDYLDRVTSSRDFRSGMLPLVAASCLLVAAKYEEGAEKIPSLSELLAAMGTPQSLTRRHLAACELEVLWLLGWTLRCATRLHFFRAFRALGLSSSQDVLEHSPPTRQEHDYMADLAKFFCDLAAQHPEFASYDHELAAAAAIAAARNATGIRPVWPKELSVRFGFSGNDVASCCGDLLGKYALAFPVRLGYVVALPESYPCSCDAPQTAPAESSCSYSPTNVAEPLSFLVSK